MLEQTYNGDHKEVEKPELWQAAQQAPGEAVLPGRRWEEE